MEGCGAHAGPRSSRWRLEGLDTKVIESRAPAIRSTMVPEAPAGCHESTTRE
jgi:hypothetical protein